MKDIARGTFRLIRADGEAFAPSEAWGKAPEPPAGGNASRGNSAIEADVSLGG
jgi:hypothetical protein